MKFFLPGNSAKQATAGRGHRIAGVVNPYNTYLNSQFNLIKIKCNISHFLEEPYLKEKMIYSGINSRALSEHNIHSSFFYKLRNNTDICKRTKYN